MIFQWTILWTKYYFCVETTTCLLVYYFTQIFCILSHYLQETTGRNVLKVVLGLTSLWKATVENSGRETTERYVWRGWLLVWQATAESSGLISSTGVDSITSLTICFIYFRGKTRDVHTHYLTVNMFVSPFMFSIIFYENKFW